MSFLAFSGFLRFLELSLIRPKDIMFGERFISAFIEKSKADQLREGQSVVIAESRSSTCPVALLILYLMSAQLLFDSDQYLFRPISASRNCKRLVSVNKAISYSTYRESFKTSFQGIVAGISKFSTHFATSAANSVISERNLQRHGRWASISAKNTYIKDSLPSRLEVSKSLSPELKPFLFISTVAWLVNASIYYHFVCSVEHRRQNM